MATPRSLVSSFRMRELKRALPQSDSSSPMIMNPFLPHKNPKTNRWAPPRYSLRRQAELVKKARSEGTLHLLPPGPKLPLSKVLATQQHEHARRTEAKGKGSAKDDQMSVQWLGEVKARTTPGADVGNRLYAAKKQMFKGHKWERVIRRKRLYRRILMRDMPKRIWRWRKRRVLRKPNPLSVPRASAKDSQKLPF